jgi:hypothetical protein
MEFKEFAEKARLLTETDGAPIIFDTVEDVRCKLAELSHQGIKGYVYSLVGNEWIIVESGYHFVDNQGYMIGLNLIRPGNFTEDVIYARPSIYPYFNVKYSPKKDEVYVMDKRGNVKFIIKGNEVPIAYLTNDNEDYGLKCWVWDNYSDVLDDMYEELEMIAMEVVA